MAEGAEIGKVIEIIGKNVRIQYERKAACANCQGCIIGTHDKEMIMTAENKAGAGLGDFVSVVLPEKQFVKAVALLYGLPLLMLLFGFFLGYKIPFFTGSTFKELFVFFCGILCMILSYGIVHLLDKKKEHTLPQVIAVHK